VACGWLHLGTFPIRAANAALPWFPYALLLGLVFISGFNTAAMTVRLFGVTVSQIMQKMSILISVPFAIFAYGESAGAGKMLGFLMALASILLVNWPSGKGSNGDASPSKSSTLLWVPLATWVLAGIIELLFIRVQQERLNDASDPTFICNVFGTAGLLGLLVAVGGWLSGRMVFAWRNVLGGILLGVPNYGSMLFMLLALGSGLEGSFVFPVANVSIIILTTIGAVALFQERLSRLNWAGIALAVIAIALISW
jgi:drug/metabolite transporter (DMT)-like permease